MCHECFSKGSHSEHSFEVKSKNFGKWKSASRTVPASLPETVIHDLQNRELEDQDYTMLSQLDTPQQQGDIPLHIINSFPVIKLSSAADCIKLKLDNKRECKICVKQICFGDIVRKIPCGHSFHQHCIGNEK
jgi:E3 ubiquitin-protein ligase ZSWIM2